MNFMLKELYDYRHLLSAFVARNIRMKYKQTVMGFLWAIFMPIIIVFSGLIVRKAMSILSKQPLETADIISVSVKSLPWAFFVGALKFAVGSLVSNMDLVSKVYFPRVILPLSYVIGSAFDLMISAIAFSVILIFFNLGVSLYLLWLPVLIVFLLLLTFGFAMILSCGNLFYRDVRYIVDVILTFAIFFTPVFFDASMFSGLKTVLLLNPIGAILENINRVVVLRQAPEYIWLLYAGIWSVASLIGGWIIFHKAEPKFAEYI
jgi:lipopolysaccharide transport system permease protein